MQVLPDRLFEPRRLGAHVATGGENVAMGADAGECGGSQWAAIQSRPIRCSCRIGDFVQSHDAANGDDAKYIRGVA
jgi:hypothetical protein